MLATSPSLQPQGQLDRSRSAVGVCEDKDATMIVVVPWVVVVIDVVEMLSPYEVQCCVFNMWVAECVCRCEINAHLSAAET